MNPVIDVEKHLLYNAKFIYYYMIFSYIILYAKFIYCYMLSSYIDYNRKLLKFKTFLISTIPKSCVVVNVNINSLIQFRMQTRMTLTLARKTQPKSCNKERRLYSRLVNKNEREEQIKNYMFKQTMSAIVRWMEANKARWRHILTLNVGFVPRGGA